MGVSVSVGSYGGSALKNLHHVGSIDFLFCNNECKASDFFTLKCVDSWVGTSKQVEIRHDSTLKVVRNKVFKQLFVLGILRF